MPLTKTIEKETVEKLAMAITHSEQGEYAVNEKLVKEIIEPLISSTRLATLKEMEEIIGTIFAIVSRVNVLSQDSELASHAKIYSNVIKDISQYLGDVTKKYAKEIKQK